MTDLRDTLSSEVPLPMSAIAAAATAATRRGVDVVVVGSLTIDFTATAERLPLDGETVLGTGFMMVPGGKGNNQAVAATRQGAQVAMVGCVGNDRFADLVVEGAAAEGCLTKCITRVDAPTGVAHISVDSVGQNRIIITPMANSALTAELVARADDTIAEAEVVLAQLEVPQEAVKEGFRLGHKYGATNILNPAPAAQLDESLLALVHYLVPNETEAAALTGVDTSTREGCLEAGRLLLAKGVSRVIITRGTAGALLVGAGGGPNGAGGVDIPPIAVTAVDATAAGDAFCGTLAAGIARIRKSDGLVSAPALIKALTRAGAAGALATTVFGALPSLPNSEQVDRILASGR